MPKIDKPKKAVKLLVKVKKIKQKIKPTLKTKSLAKSHPVRSKQNTLAYYHCFIDQIANPLNDKKKITQIAHQCKCKKGEVVKSQQEHKQQLLKQVAQSYLTFGESLGHLIHADVVGCAKELKK